MILNNFFGSLFFINALEVESSWIDGLTSFANISVTFPWISTCRLMASDQEVGHLNFLPHLRHLEVD